MAKDSSIPQSLASPEIDTIDSSWDDDAEAPDASVTGLVLVPDPEESDAFDRVTAIPEMPPSDYVRHAMGQLEEEKSGVQAIAERPSAKPTPSAGTPPRPPRVPEFDLAIDEPTAHHGTFDDLSLELGAKDAPEPMLEPSSLEFDLEAALKSSPPAEDPAVVDMRDRYAAGDFTGALILAESLLETDPNHDEAQRFAQSCRDVLTQMYAARLGSLDEPVHVAIPPDQVRWLSLDHRAGFLLSMVDGYSTVEEILDVCGMPRLEALRILYTLLEQQIIALGRG
ncbi:MAG: hypothetical protein U0263_23650 [Polyangiaceae bacterium]